MCAGVFSALVSWKFRICCLRFPSFFSSLCSLYSLPLSPSSALSGPLASTGLIKLRGSPTSGEMFVQVDQVVVLCVLVEGRKDKWWVRAFCFNVKAGDHYHIKKQICFVCFCTTGTLPAEALLRRVRTQRANTAFLFKCVCPATVPPSRLFPTS